MTNKQKAVIKAVERVKSCPYKATAIKVELEANIDRNWDLDECHEYMMERLEELGLSDGRNRRGALVYALTYNDGSVNTEFTFTLMLTKTKDIFLLPKIIEIWNDMCQEAGGNVNVEGAGMHMAWLSDPKGYYPGVITAASAKRFVYFQRAMTLMLPALYFLATHNETSRRLGQRFPIVKMSNAAHGHDKFNAITYKGGALEFRVFDTCYDQPEAILDNVVVMSNAMKYWTNKYNDPGLSKIANNVPFGNDESRRLERFYVCVEHLDLLHAGLEKLKPDYLTIDELKTERNFTITRPSFINAEAEIAERARAEYAEYEERFRWRMELDKNYWLAEAVEKAHIKDKKATHAVLRRQAMAQVQRQVDIRMRQMQTLDRYVAQKVRQYQQRNLGQWELAV